MAENEDEEDLARQLKYLEEHARLAEIWKECGYTEAQFIDALISADTLLSLIADQLQADPDSTTLNNIVEAIALKDAGEDGLSESYRKASLYLFGVRDG